MMFNLCLMLAAGANAALVTQFVRVTQYVYEDVHVFVDSNGNPVSSSINYVATTLPVSSAVTSTAVADATATSSEAPGSVAPAAPSAAPAPTTEAAASHDHEYSNGPFQIILSSSEEPVAAPAPTSDEPAIPVVETSEPPAPVPTTSSEAPAPAPTSEAPEAPAPAPTSEAPEAPAPAPTSEAPAPAPTSEAPEAPAPAPTSEAPAPAPTSEAPASGSGETFSGKATYYDVGLGACGITNTDDELIVALNVDQFGAQSNGNPVCNKKIILSRGGKSVTVTVTDKCPGCKYGDLDLSPAAFNQIADEAEGRVDITWQWAS